MSHLWSQRVNMQPPVRRSLSSLPPSCNSWSPWVPAPSSSFQVSTACSYTWRQSEVVWPVRLRKSSRKPEDPMQCKGSSVVQWDVAESSGCISTCTGVGEGGHYMAWGARRAAWLRVCTQCIGDIVVGLGVL